MEFQEFKKKIQDHGQMVKEQRQLIPQDEASTKQFLILPFIEILGYDPRRREDIILELVADMPGCKGEKVDYGLCKDGKGIILVECKCCREKIDGKSDHKNQLMRYFNASPEKVGILTNGVEYQFFTEIEPNKMDEKPFLQFDITSGMNDSIIEALMLLRKDEFNVDQVTGMAGKLKIGDALQQWLEREMASPSADFTVFVFRACGRINLQGKGKIEAAEQLQQAIGAYFGRLVEAESVQGDEKPQPQDAGQQAEVPPEVKEAYEIVRGIIRKSKTVDLSRITIAPIKNNRGEKGFIIRLDNQLTPICRLFLKANKKRMILFDKPEPKGIRGKVGRTVELAAIGDISKHKAALLQTLDGYLAGGAGSPSAE